MEYPTGRNFAFSCTIASPPALFGSTFLAFPTKRSAKADFGHRGHDKSYSARIRKYWRQSKAQKTFQNKAPRSRRKPENKKERIIRREVYGDSLLLALMKSRGFFRFYWHFYISSRLLSRPRVQISNLKAIIDDFVADPKGVSCIASFSGESG